MAHQVPHPVPVADDDDVAHLSTPGLGVAPRTLSFINNVQSAVAQIEHRLATSPSAQPPPPSRHELPQTPPGPNDSIIDRVQFLESSLSLAPPTSSNPTSHSGSSFAGAINFDTSLVSSGAILSTAPPNNINPNASTPVDNCHTSENQPQLHLPSAPALETADNAIDTPASSIAPIVEHFETVCNPAHANEQRSEIVAAPIAPIVEQFEVPATGTPQAHQATVDDVTSVPIAPIVEHFETAPQHLEGTSDAQNIEPSDEAPIAPLVKNSETPVVDDKRFMSSTNLPPNDADVDTKPTAFEKNETASNTTSKQVEPEIAAESDVIAAVPAVSSLERDCASGVATFEAPLSSQEKARSTSNVTDESTPIPVIDHDEQVTDDVETTSMSGGASAEIDRANAAALLPPQIAESQSPKSDAAELDPSCNGDGKSQSLTKADDEETNASEEGTEEVRQQSDLGGLPEDVSLDRTEPKSDEDIGDTSLEIVDVAVSAVRQRDEEGELQAALDDGTSTPSALDSAAVMKTVSPKAIATSSLHMESRADASSTPTSISDSVGEIEIPIRSSVSQESLDVGVPSRGSELNGNEEISPTTVGDTSPTEEGELSNIYMGKSANIGTISEDDIRLAPASDTIDRDHSTIADTENAVRDSGVSEAEQTTSYECKVSENSAQHSSGSTPEDKDSPRTGCDSNPPDEVGPNASLERQSPSDATRMNQYTPQENPVETEPEVKEVEEDIGHEENATGVQQCEEVSSALNVAEEQEDEAAVGAKDEPKSSVRREPNTQIHRDGNQRTNEQEAREIMAAKAVLARDKLAKLSLGSPVKKPHRGPIIRKTGDARESLVKGAGSIAVFPRTRRSPGGCNPKNSSFNRTKLAATSHPPPISVILDKAYNSPEQRKLRSPSASSRGTDSIFTGLRPLQCPIETRRTPPPRPRSAAGSAMSDSRQEPSGSEPHSPLLLSQPSSDNKPRLPRVAALTSARSGSPRTPHSAPNLRAKTRIPRAATFSTTAPRSKTTLSSPILGRRVGISSSPVTPTSVGKSSGAGRPQLRRTLSFTQTKPSVEPTSPLSRPASSRVRGNEVSRALSLSTSGSKPPRGVRPRFTVPEPFALTGPELQDRTEKQMEQARRRAAEAETRPRVFKPRPMPDFSKPHPKPK